MPNLETWSSADGDGVVATLDTLGNMAVASLSVAGSSITAAPPVFTPMNYHAAGDGIKDDTTAVQAAFAAAAAATGIVDLGTKTFKTTAPIPAYSNMYVRGSGQNGVNGGVGGTIVNSTSSLFTFGSSGVYGVTFKDCALYANGSGTGAGHIWDLTAGPSVSDFTALNVVAQQTGTGCSVFSQVGGLFINCQIDAGCNFWGSANATVPAWSSLQCQNTTVSFSNGRGTYNGNNSNVPFFLFDWQTASGYGHDLNFKNWVVELASAGVIHATGIFNINLENVQAWDQGAAAANVFDFRTSANGHPCRNVTLKQCGNNGTAVGRYDTGLGSTTFNVNTVTDSAAVSGDIGSTIINNPYIPYGTTITGITSGPTGYTLSANALGTSTGQTFIVTKYFDVYCDSQTTNVRLEGAGAWGTPPIISSPPNQTVITEAVGQWSTQPNIAQFPAISVAGVPGAVSPSRYIGATAGGHPTGGLVNVYGGSTAYSVGDWAVDTSASPGIWVCTVPGNPGTWVSIAAASGYALINDPTSLGFTSTYLRSNDSGTSTFANGGMSSQHMRLAASGYTISHLIFNVGISYGNISAGVFAGTGSGTSQTPGTLLATTSGIPCPAVGISTVNFGSSPSSSATPGIAGWAGLSCDNNIASFTVAGGTVNSTMSSGMQGGTYARGYGDLGCSAAGTVTVADTHAATGDAGLGVIVAPARSDTLCTVTSGVNTIIDSHAVATDIGATIFNATTPGNIPAGTTITGITSSPVGYTMSANAVSGAGTATQTLVIGPAGLSPARSDALCTFTTTTAVTDPHAVAGDIGAIITDTTNPTYIPAGTYIIGVSGTTYTLSQATTQPNSGSGDTLLVGNQVIPPNTIISTVSAGTGYTLSNPAALTAAGLTFYVGDHPLTSSPPRFGTTFCALFMMKGS